VPSSCGGCPSLLAASQAWDALIMKVNWTHHDYAWGFQGVVLRMYTVRSRETPSCARVMVILCACGAGDSPCPSSQGSNTQRVVGVPPQNTNTPCFTTWVIGQYVQPSPVLRRTRALPSARWQGAAWLTKFPCPCACVRE
jgi:hypothetical protein